ncbi:MAG: patatin-like phospholipase family protein [Rhodobacteraceae bacterium]|nr:patatin-like phospholipase family protein [Paracoccaceae bacterium]
MADGFVPPTEKKKLLALDGGGILGMMSLQILKEIESKLAQTAPDPEKFRLGDYFDYIGGTSTGGIIAAGLAMGMSVDQLIRLYRDKAADIFEKRTFMFRRMWRGYNHDKFVEILKKELIKDGKDTIADLRDGGHLHCMLLIALRNASTASPWTASSNECDPFAVPLGKLKLWEVVRASTAAPTYFAPQKLPIRNERGEPVMKPKGSTNPRLDSFEDGGVTAYNNPSVALFRHAALSEHWTGGAHWPDPARVPAPKGTPWATGENRMLLVSVGCGEAREATFSVKESGNFLLKTAAKVPSDLMSAYAMENDIMCRTLGRCVFGPKIDLLYDRMQRSAEETGGTRAFSYIRYNPEVSPGGLKELEIKDWETLKMGMADIDKLDRMEEVGRLTAKQQVDVYEHFAGFLPSDAEVPVS